MKRLIILGVLAAASYGGMQYFIMHAGPGLTFAQLFIDASALIKLLALLLNLVAGLLIVLGLVSLFDRSGGARKVLTAGTWAAPALGALGALYGAMTIVAGINAVGGHVDSRVWAPGAAEALLPLFEGFLAAAIAAVFLLKKPPAPAEA